MKAKKAKLEGEAFKGYTPKEQEQAKRVAHIKSVYSRISQK